MVERCVDGSWPIVPLWPPLNDEDMLLVFIITTLEPIKTLHELFRQDHVDRELKIYTISHKYSLTEREQKHRLIPYTKDQQEAMPFRFLSRDRLAHCSQVASMLSKGNRLSVQSSAPGFIVR